MNIFEYHLRLRYELLEKFRSSLDERDIKTALKDHHSKRGPIPCGLTIHTGIGCPYRCTYCYIYSMGFPKRIRRYPLSPYQLVYSILSNRHFIPGRYGTLLALGSVTEPFHQVTKEYTLELISILYTLGNPIQVSTKEALEEGDIYNLLKFKDRLNILLTITTLKKPNLLEPYAPDPYRRLESAGVLIEKGVSTTLFVRPIIPGITDVEFPQILNEAGRLGFKEVILGTLRVNSDILSRLKTLPSEIYNEIVNRSPETIGRSQKPIYLRDIKEKLVKLAIRLGFKVLPAACSASIISSGQACNMCRYGPCGTYDKLPRISEEEVKDFLESKNIRVFNVEVDKWNIKIESSRKISKNIQNVLKTVSRRSLHIKAY